jgi:general secretion pathway protein N
MRRVIVLLAALLALAPVRAQTRNPLDGLRLEALTATRERPLFRPTRRPWPPAAVATPAPAPAPIAESVVAQGPPPYDLVGAVVGQNTAVALLRSRATNEILRLHMGDETEGWRVARIGLRTVELTRDGRMQSLVLSKTTAQPGAEPASEPQRPEPVVVPALAEVRRIADRRRTDH